MLHEAGCTGGQCLRGSPPVLADRGLADSLGSIAGWSAAQLLAAAGSTGMEGASPRLTAAPAGASLDHGAASGVLVTGPGVTLEGSFVVSGLVVATGDLTLAGNAQVFGGVVVPGDSGFAVTIAGGAQVLRSACALEWARIAIPPRPGRERSWMAWP